jgi:hypothetical protein
MGVIRGRAEYLLHDNPWVRYDREAPSSLAKSIASRIVRMLLDYAPSLRSIATCDL